MSLLKTMQSENKSLISFLVNFWQVISRSEFLLITPGSAISADDGNHPPHKKKTTILNKLAAHLAEVGLLESDVF